MNHSKFSLTRRNLLTGVATTAALSSFGVAAEKESSRLILPKATHGSAQSLAADEGFWAEVATYYDRTQGIVNLEHGYWGKMAKPVIEAYQRATKMVNDQNSFYARKDFPGDIRHAMSRVAHALGAQDGEIVLTRNATEAIHNLIRQYQGLNVGDGVLFADSDYPSFKTTMKWLEQDQGVESIEVITPSLADQQQLLQAYIAAFDKHPNIKLMLLTHVSNQHGLVFPVVEIVEEAKKRGIDVICDCAQSWGLIDYKISDLNVNWAGFNLHKWIGSPVGVGALYMQKGTLDKIAPYPGESDPNNNRAYTRVHTATANFAAFLTVPVALDFHQAIGGENKQARLKYLRDLWFSEAQSMGHIEVLGGKDSMSATGMSSFRIKGKTTIDDANQLQQKLEKDFGIFTVIRKGLDSGACVRITPQVFTSADEIQQLVESLKKLA
ncbi:aminotransferase class V-fold PLP-dependent enzyme [Aliiglaciecola sp. 2_MG-2023]|uniref:aminotransferase class V-fold PLP-dependent enzyme n=1 Tax=unclassified Aliiglaciecola TaxID=2593648 RepID=UPI0026E12BB2|nr:MULTISPECIES: aminotransferase class V-fold PLP-dependent enzyme [unclassified Aliiglaciecola]MDO6711940.1 aminotransferase class V-fold PLP-dependent enzyme [Aliiglaciecola sp. 2_MG-2023]MDO6753086.1 aminotransferase class V-fold PLP-dependent enzyme [Aliiglaciecola sp. 1_MG-2023]